MQGNTSWRYALLASALLAACGSEAEPSPGTDDDMNPMADMAQPADMTQPADMADDMSTPAPRSWRGQLVDTSWGRLDPADPAGPVALILHEGKLEAVSAARQRVVSTSATSDASLASRQETPLCASWVSAGEVQLGCAPDFAIMARAATDGEGYHLSVTPDASVLWYKQGASAGQLALDGGALTPVELFESSVSYFTDATAYTLSFAGAALTTSIGCMISSSGQPKLKGLSDNAIRVNATRCLLNANGERLLTLSADSTAAAVTLSRINAELGTLSSRTIALPFQGAEAIVDMGQDIVVLRLVAGEAHALVLSSLAEPPSSTLLTATIKGGPVEAWASLGELTKIGAVATGSGLQAFVQTAAGEVHLVELTREQLPAGDPSEGQTFTQLALPADVSSAAISSDGAAYFSGQRAAYRVRPGQAVEQLGSLGFNASFIFPEGADAVRFVDSSSTSPQLQRWSGSMGAVTMLSDIYFPAKRVYAEKLYMISRPNQTNQEPCLVRVEPTNTLTTIMCMPTLSVAEFGQDPIFYTLFGATEQDTTFLLRSGKIVDRDGQEQATSLSAHVTGQLRIESAQQTDDGALWILNNNSKLHVLGDEGWRDIALPSGVTRADTLYAASEELAWIVSDRAVYRYQGSVWSEMTLGFMPSQRPKIYGTAARGLLLIADGKAYQER